VEAVELPPLPAAEAALSSSRPEAAVEQSPLPQVEAVELSPLPGAEAALSPLLAGAEAALSPLQAVAAR
jgi:hypothetical protein